MKNRGYAKFGGAKKHGVLWEMCKLVNAYAQFWRIKLEYYV